MSSPFIEQPDTSSNQNAGRKAARAKTTDGANKLELLQLEDRLVPAGQITGQVFLDFNSNGLLDTSTTLNNDGFGTYTRQTDKGVAAVVVQAYDSSNVLQGAATTAADGTYTLAATGTGGYRLEFSNVPTGNFTGSQGANVAPPPQGSGTSVQFVPDGNSANRNLSISLPSGYADNPQLITSSYLVGDQSGLLATGPKFGTANVSSSPVIISFPYSAGTTEQNNVANAQIPTGHALAVQAKDVGTTWGLAQNTSTNTILASAFTKKHTGYGPSGSGAIYTMGTTGTTASLWLDLGTAVAGGNFRSGYTNNDDYFTDSGNTGWDAVGKTSFGGLAINSTNTEVYVINLADRRLYTIQVNANGSAGAVTSILIPTPANATGNVTGINRGDLRPFAVEYRNGLVYVGMVNSAESTQARSDLRAYVYTYNPSTQAWSTRSAINESGTVDGFRLDYARATSFGGSDNFLAWSNVFKNVNAAFSPGVNNAVKYPQPILSGIAFDSNGNLNLAFRDRAGDQLGNQIESDPALPGQLDLGISAGDLLKATNNNNGTWTLENNGTAGSTTGGANNAQGPGGGEFFYQDDYDNGTHTDVSSGAVAQVPGFPDVISTTFDPVRQTNLTKAAGVRWYNETTGTVTKAYQIYDNSVAGTFGKATGTGDLLVVQPPAGREIGNRVWNDVNGNGRQDPGENGITGVQVVLFLGNTGFATATTEANGEYYFSSNAGTNTSNKIFGLNLAQAGTYTIGIPVIQGPLAGLSLTTSNVNANSEDQRDSDFTLNAIANRADFVVPTILAGESNHTFDAGFRLPASAKISGFVYADRNNNGQYEPGLPNNEPSIGGVTIVLTGADSVGNPIVPLTTTTDSTGFYQFAALGAGTYTVSETQPTSFLDGKDTPGTPGGGNVSVKNKISSIMLATGDNSINNNFGELEPAAVSGFVYLDANNDGTFQGTETAIAGVTVVLTGTNDLVEITPQTLTTLDSGAYSFTNLRPGTYTVTETQPPQYANGLTTPGSPGGSSTPNNHSDIITTIALTAKLASLNNNFGEQPLAASSLSGFVFFDPNNDGVRDGPPGEPGIPGTIVVLTGVTTLGVTIVAQTQTTDGIGFYNFTGLQAGTYKVSETQPANYLNGKTIAGNFGGIVTNDIIDAVTLAASVTGVNYNFGELLPAAISGFTYLDANNDGIFQPTETAIPGVKVVLSGTNDLGAIAPQTLTTGSLGAYNFTNLRPGTYTAFERQPTQYANGLTTPGAPGGGTTPNNQSDLITSITLTPNLASLNNNFGERSLPGMLSGYVYRDPNVNGIREPELGEKGIPGTKVVLFFEGPNGPVAVQTAFTASDGFYKFNNLAPGNYRVAETQPLGFFNGINTVGSTGGSNALHDILSAIPVTAGGNSVNNNFGEIPSVNLFGYVWIDNNRNGIFDPGEAGIPNAVVTISGTAFAGTPIANAINAAQAPSGLSIVTDANGRYDFFKLPSGSYSLAQTNTPIGLTDFASQNAAPGLPIQLSTNTTFTGIGLNAPAPGPLNFGKVSEGGSTSPITGDPSKQAFLGSSPLGVAGPTGNPLVGPPTAFVNTNPTFGVTNSTSVKPVYLAAGAGAGFSPTVRVFNYRTGAEIFRFLAFDVNFLGGVETATGDVNGDGTPDIIVAAGPGAGPHVKVFDGLTGAEIRSFYAYDPSFRGGVMVASADVNGDGFDDIITGAMSEGGPHVKVFDGKTGAEIASFYAFDPSLTTGVRVAAADINGDGKADIVVSTGPGTPARVRVFDGRNQIVLSDFSPFSGFTGGIYVAAGDFDGDTKGDIFVSAGAGGGPRVSVFNAGGTELTSFYSGDASLTSGIRVAAKDLNGDGKADIITGAGIGTASRISAFSGAGLGLIEDFYLFDSGVRTGVFVG